MKLAVGTGLAGVVAGPFVVVFGLALLGSTSAATPAVCTPAPPTSSAAPTLDSDDPISVVEQTECAQTVVSGSGWASPEAPQAHITSGFNPARLHPTLGYVRPHLGTDFSGGSCGEAIFAANDGTVTRAGLDPTGLGIIEIDHTPTVTTKYLHMYASGIFVHPGQHVVAGQQIGATGSSGNSTGCHLHFEVWLDGTAIDPVPFLETHVGGVL